jgi:hypothetical protein
VPPAMCHQRPSSSSPSLTLLLSHPALTQSPAAAKGAPCLIPRLFNSQVASRLVAADSTVTAAGEAVLPVAATRPAAIRGAPPDRNSADRQVTRDRADARTCRR